MRLRRIGLMMAIALMAAFSGLPGALAAHSSHPNASDHESMPTPVPNAPEGVCVVDGDVDVTPGVNSEHRHNHYTFKNADLRCRSATNPNLDGTFDVDADGGTDGPDGPATDPTHGDHIDHGETCAEGWSHSSGFSGGSGSANVNKGDISAKKTAGAGSVRNGSGWVKFTRVGTVVIAWGEITFPAAGGNPAFTIKFYAVLNFTPTAAADWPQGCAGTVATQITKANIDGTAKVEEL